MEAHPEAADRGVVIGVDIGGTKTALMLADVATGDELARETLSTPCDAGPKAMLEIVFDAIGELTRAAGRPGELRAAGFAVPGRVGEDGQVLVAGNLAGWTDVPLRRKVKDGLGVPAYVGQDANTAALGERWRGCAKAMSNFVFLALGTGVGAGVVINGRIHRGYHCAAGEIGDMIMGREHLNPGGRKGPHNLGALIGGKVIRARARRAAGEELSAAEAIERGEEDKQLEDLVQRVTDYVAMAVIAIAAVVDPEAIVFGGGTSAAGDDFIERVRARVEAELPVVPRLVHSALGEDAQLHGAVFGALWQLDPALALREELR